MKTILVVGVIIIAHILSSCSSCKVPEVNNSDNNTKKTLKLVANAKFGNDFKISLNSQKSYAIVWKEIEPNIKISPSRISFFLYDINNNKKIYEDTFNGSYVFWESDFVVRTGRLPGMVKKNSESPFVIGGYSFNVLTGKKEFK